MPLGRSVFVAVLLGCCALPACSISSDPESAGSESDLIGGVVAPASAFPSTLQIVNNCTVTKVGDRLLLTAAHCVRTPEGDVTRDFQPGMSIDLRVRSGKKREESRSAAIARTVLHPRIAELCKASACGDVAADERRDAPDLAVIELDGGLDGIPIAAVDVTPPRPGDAVTVLGYGCLTNIRTADDDRSLRYRDTRIIGPENAVHPGGFAKSETEALTTLEANYNLTRGPAILRSLRPDAGGDAGAPETLAGLCPGDSGGGLFRAGQNIVVGVNASYTFLIDGIVPRTNWHSRVDGLARWGTAAWLESVGVALTKPCSAKTCTPTAPKLP